MNACVLHKLIYPTNTSGVLFPAGDSQNDRMREAIRGFGGLFDSLFDGNMVIAGGFVNRVMLGMDVKVKDALYDIDLFVLNDSSRTIEAIVKALIGMSGKIHVYSRLL